VGSLPPEVAAEVDRRQASMVARARGRVLDLGRPEARDVLRAAASARADGVSWDAASRYDTVVDPAVLVHEPDLARAVGGLVALLADDGELLLVEPVLRPGLMALVVASIGSSLPAVRGLHVSRDVVGALRAAGLTAADVERFEVATPAWPLRHLVEVRAVRIQRRAPASEEAA
jgi:hypothetical protein